jgi:hypothetical protein
VTLPILLLILPVYVYPYGLAAAASLIGMGVCIGVLYAEERRAPMRDRWSTRTVELTEALKKPTCLRKGVGR